MKKKIIIAVLSALMPIFCLLYAKNATGYLSNIDKRVIEKQFYDKEISKHGYHEQRKKLSAITQTISNRKNELTAEKQKMSSSYDDIKHWMVIPIVFSIFLFLKSIPRDKVDFRGQVYEESSNSGMMIAAIMFIGSCCVGSYCFYMGEASRDQLQKYQAENFISDSQISTLQAEQKKIEEYLANCEQTVQKSIRLSVDSVYLIEVEKQQATRQAEADKLQEFIKKNNVSKKLKIIACSWEKEADTQEHGSLNGDLSSIGGGGGVLGIGGGVGAGMSKSNGKINGRYTGRIYGEEFYLFHFILSDNSYHVINAKEHPEWRMAKKHLVVKYEKLYTDYTQYKETLTPLWIESFI